MITYQNAAGGVLMTPNNIISGAYAIADLHQDTNLRTSPAGVSPLVTSSSGTGVISGGKWVATSNDVSYVRWSSIDPSSNGAIKLKYTPNYSGAPSSNSVGIIGFGDGSTTNSLLRLYHATSSGYLMANFYDSAGGVIYTSNTYAWTTNVSGTEYEIELDWALSGGTGTTTLAGHLFIGGSAVATISATNKNPRTTASYLQLGGSPYGTSANKCNGSFRDVVVYNAVQHTSSYSAGYTITGLLNLNSDLAVTNTTTSSSTATGALTVAGGVGVGENLYVGGINFYLGGTQFIISNTTISTTLSGPWASPLSNETVYLTKVGNMITVNYPIGKTGAITSSQYTWGFPTSLPSGYYNTNRNLACPIAFVNNNAIQMAIVYVNTDGTWSGSTSPTLMTGTCGVSSTGFTITYSLI
jgi:hypothetical protein